MTHLTPSQFDGLTLEERDAYLDRRDAEERQRAIAMTTKADAFMRFAFQLLRQERSLIFNLSSLAARVADKCRDAGIVNPRGGEPYSSKTAYNFLAANRLRLLDALAGESPASMDFPLHTAKNHDHGTAENLK